MPVAQVIFRKCIMNSSEHESTEEHVDARIFLT